MTSTHADDRLVALIRHGDEAAISEFLHRFRPRLVSITRRRARPDDVEDLVEDVLTTAILQIRDGRFRAESALATWLIAILRRSVARRHDLRRRLVTHVGRVEQGWFPALAQNQSLATQETVVAVRETLGTLHPLHGTVLWLNVVEGRTIAEIAGVLRRPQGTIGRVLSEAKELFARAYSTKKSGGIAH